jgi:hypothetical protein
MTRYAILTGLVVSLIPVESASPRNIGWVDYDELFAKSDFVVIAEPASKTRDTHEHAFLTENISPGVRALGVVTDFRCLFVLKGPKRQNFTLHHYRLAPAPASKQSGGVERVILNGPTFQTYEPQPGTQPFLMFLIRQRDGRFAPVAGQVDLPISVQEIHRM